jgi:hypothetical protein
MKLRLLLSGLFALLFVAPSYSQPRLTDSIEFHSSFMGVARYYSSDRKLAPAEVREYMKANTEAYKLFNKSRTLNTVSVVLGVVGGFMVGYELGASLGGNRDINWGVMGAGLGLTGVSIAFDIGSKSSGKKAVRLYNERFR